MGPTHCDHLSATSGAPGEWRKFFEHIRKSQGCPLIAAQQWVRVAEASTGGISPNSLMSLLKWVQVEVPVSHGGELLFRLRLLELDTSMQKALLSVLIQYAKVIRPADVGKMLTAAQALDTSDPWVTQLLTLLNKKVQPSPSYAFTQPTHDPCYNAAARIMDGEACGLKNVSPVAEGESVKDVPCDVSSIHNDETNNPVENQRTPGVPAAPSSQAQLPETPGMHSQAAVPMEKPVVQQLDAHLQGDVLALAEVWHVERFDEDSIPTQVQCFVTMSAQQLELACSALMLDKIPEASLPRVCGHIARLGDRLSNTSAEYLVRTCIRSRVQALTQNASRSLIAAVTVMATSFPQPIIAGVLVPCVTQHDATSPQADIVGRVVRDVFKSQSRIDLLRELAEVHDKWNEAVLSVIQTLLDIKTGVDGAVLGGMVEHVRQVAGELCASTKLAKVILTLIQKHGKQLTVAHVGSLKAVLQRNTTFLRKPAIAALSRLKV